ncbi:MAG: cytochrome c maturation protein CcmE [Chloroflexi bacterium]|nr:cytochrome c maturation protein CcmE [Chloroflexota bacterium]
MAKSTGMTTGAVTSKKKGLFRGRRKFLIAGIIVVLALGYAIYAGFQSASMYFLTVGELKARGETAYGERLRVNGKVGPDIVWDNQSTTMKFNLIDGQGESLPVVYKGVVPDLFKPDADVVVEGVYTAGGVFESTKLLTKCPSKFTPKL